MNTEKQDTEEDKKKKETAHKIAERLNDFACDKAENSTGLLRWIWGILAILAAAVAWFTLPGCAGAYKQAADGATEARWIFVLPEKLGK